MVQYLNIWDYVVIGFVLAVSLCIGLYFRFTGGRQKTLEEFMLGGRNMAILPVAVSLLATFMSAIAMLGIPAEVYLHGLQYSACLLGLPFGYLLCAFGCLPTYFDLNVSTSYEYLEIRFGKTIRNIGACLFIIRAMFHTALALYTPSLALNAVTGLSTWTSIITLVTVCSFYCFLGGLKAVVWTDIFQSILMWIPLAAVIVKGAMDIGVTELLKINEKGGRMIFFNFSFDFTERYTFWNSVQMGAFIVIESSTTIQSQVQRLLSLGSFKKAKWSLFWGMTLIGIFHIFLFLTGMVLYGIFHNCDPVRNPEVKLGSLDQMLPYTILMLFGDILFLPGLCISGIFSGALSSVSSSLNSMAAVTVEDFLKPYCKWSKFKDKTMNIVAKLLAVAFGCISLLLIVFVSNFQGIFEACYVMNGVYGGPFISVYLLAMFTTTANEPGIIIGFISGFVFNCWIAFGNYMFKPRLVTLSRSISECKSSMNDSSNIWDSYMNLTHTLELHTELRNVTVAVNEDRYIFPMYKMSSLWMMTSGMMIVLIVGYMSSLIIGFFRDSANINPKCISPFVRKFYFASSEINITRKEVEMKDKEEISNHQLKT